MKTKIRSRLDFYSKSHPTQRADYQVRCPRCGMVSNGSEVRGARPESTIETVGLQPSMGIVPSDRWESWATDLEIDRGFEDATR